MMLTDEDLFEANIMPKLQAKYNYAKDHDRTNFEFTVERVREFLKEGGGGFGIMGWDDTEIRDNLLRSLVNKGLIREVSSGSYTITEEGINWGKNEIRNTCDPNMEIGIRKKNYNIKQN